LIPKDYGADGVRVGLLLSSAAGNDLMFVRLCVSQGKKLCNKIWNGFDLGALGRMGGLAFDESYLAAARSFKLGIRWYTAKFNKTFAEIEDHLFSKYVISDAFNCELSY